MPSSLNKTTTQLSLGNTLRALGTRDLERQALPRYDYIPWRCQREKSDNQQISSKALNYYAQAQQKYQQAVRIPQISTAIKAKINLASLLLIKEKNSLETHSLSNLLVEIDDDLSRLPISQIKIYLQIQHAQNNICLAYLKNEIPDWMTLENNFKIAYNYAEELNDTNAQSYVLGNWGGLYESYIWWVKQAQNNQRNIAQLCNNYQRCWKKAEELTEKALELRQSHQNPQIAYQWQWQLGRLLEAQRKTEKAIATYQEAAKSLELVRNNLLTVNTDVQFSFRDNVEPLYRKLVSLLLSSQASLNNPKKIQQALYYIESLQLAELETFLRCDPKAFSPISINRLPKQESALDAFEQRINSVVHQDANAAIIYPIVLQRSP